MLAAEQVSKAGVLLVQVLQPDLWLLLLAWLVLVGGDLAADQKAMRHEG